MWVWSIHARSAEMSYAVLRPWTRQRPPARLPPDRLEQLGRMRVLQHLRKQCTERPKPAGPNERVPHGGEDRARAGQSPRRTYMAQRTCSSSNSNHRSSFSGSCPSPATSNPARDRLVEIEYSRPEAVCPEQGGHSREVQGMLTIVPRELPAEVLWVGVWDRPEELRPVGPVPRAQRPSHSPLLGPGLRLGPEFVCTPPRKVGQGRDGERTRSRDDPHLSLFISS